VGVVPVRRWITELEADTLLVVEVILCLSLWGPQIVLWLMAGSWVGDRVAVTGAAAATVALGLAVSASVTLALARRVDNTRVHLLAVAGKDPSGDPLATTIVGLTIVTVAAALIWALFVQGLGPLLISG